MDREVVLLALVLACSGPAFLAGGLRRPAGPGPIGRSERHCWTGVWMPALPAAVLLCGLIGWSVREPADSEALPWTLVFMSSPAGMVWVRAAIRALRALWSPPTGAYAAAVGLFRPRVVIDQRLRAALDPAALHAVEAHEWAHARHRDPLRIWLAQLITDVQWPLPHARARFEAWLTSLEMVRDDDARRAGIDGADLAAAVITAAQFGTARAAGARITGDGHDLADRVDRLLQPLPPAAQPERAPATLVMIAPLFGLAIVAGAWFGEIAIRTLLSTLP